MNFIQETSGDSARNRERPTDMIGRKCSGMTTRRILAGVMMCGALLAAAASVHAGQAGKLVASTESPWPQWRGPRRDGVSDEKGLLQSWPEGGPKVLWSAKGMGKGFSSPVIGAGAVYVTGDVGKELHIFALDMTGKVKWTAVNGKAWTKSFPGSRSSCAYAAGKVYHMNAHGRVVCLRADDGKEVWAVETLTLFGGTNITWGTCESVLVDGERVIVTPAGTRGQVAALNAKTGKTLWKTTPLPDERIGYASPILITRGHKRLVIACTARNTVAVEAETGKRLWAVKHTISDSGCTTIPVLIGDSVFVTNSSRSDYYFYRIKMADDNASAKKVWTEKLSNSHGSVIAVDGLIYGSSSRKPTGFRRIDPETGKTTATSSIMPGSLIHADGRFYYLTDTGMMMLIATNDTGFKLTGNFTLAQAKKKDAWAHPVICDAKLYLRYHDTLTCYDISAK